jgi:hypothetical protein
MMTVKKAKPGIIPLAEDNRGSQELTRRALGEGKIRNDLRIVEDGEEALAFFFAAGNTRTRPPRLGLIY